MNLPRYQCHKQVRAIKIGKIVMDADNDPDSAAAYRDATITPAEAGVEPFRVTSGYMAKHSPEVGGYYVVYDDGYTSYSPAHAFETGYSRIDEAEAVPA